MSWAEARDPHMYRPIAISVLMRFLQQLTGITPILVYLQPIFNSTAVLLVRAQPPHPASQPRHSHCPLPSTCSAPCVKVHVQVETARDSKLSMPCTPVLRVTFASEAYML